MAKSNAKAAPAATDTLTCWDIENWPPNIFPHDGKRGRHLVRSNKTSLVAAGVISRVGREIIVFGKPYYRWLQRQSSRVMDYELPCNAPDQLAKRGGKPKAQ